MELQINAGRGPGFHIVVGLGYSSPLSRQQVVSLFQSSCVLPVELTDGREGRGGGGTKSYNGEVAWSSINRSLLSDRSLQQATKQWQALYILPRGAFLNQS
jgi:hypothetical protein